LAAPLPRLTGPAQQPVERGDRPEVDAFIQQRGPHLGRREVDEPVAVQLIEDRRPLGQAQRPRLDALAVPKRHRPWRGRTLPVPPVVAGLRRTHRLAGFAHANPRGQLCDRGVGHGVHRGSVSALSESVSKSSCSFACTSTTKRALASYLLQLLLLDL
jgi:hypothetical protein